MRSCKMVTGSGRATILRHRHNMDRKSAQYYWYSYQWGDADYSTHIYRDRTTALKKDSG